MPAIINNTLDKVSYSSAEDVVIVCCPSDVEKVGRVRIDVSIQQYIKYLWDSGTSKEQDEAYERCMNGSCTL